jgi:hypothetical protein
LILQSISDLLEAAAKPMIILANSSTTKRTDLESQKTAFTEVTTSYFSRLSNIDVRLRRNVYALEEAGLVPPGDQHRDRRRGEAAVHNDESRAGGNGLLDSSWLAARSGDSVSRGMDEEIWADARKLVEHLEAKMSDERPDGGEDMEVDPKDG